jgi:hypothetical protein
MSRFQCDIRQLLFLLPGTILRPMHHTVAEGVQSLDLDRMESQVKTFSQALKLDLIGPDDFQSLSDLPA